MAENIKDRLQKAYDFYGARGESPMKTEERERLSDLLRAASSTISDLMRRLDEAEKYMDGAHNDLEDLHESNDDMVRALRDVLAVASEITGNSSGPSDGSEQSYRWVEARTKAHEALYWAEQDVIPYRDQEA